MQTIDSILHRFTDLTSRLSGYKLIFLLLLCLSSFGTFAAQPEIQIFTKFPQQGSMIVGRVLVEGRVFFRKQELPLTDTGEFVFGIGRDEIGEVILNIKSKGKNSNFPIAYEKRQWKIEVIDGLPESKVNPHSKETLKRIRKETQKVVLARQSLSERNSFLMQFSQPAEGRISGVYGSQRVLNGEKKRPHFGLDIANSIGTLVSAPADGIVTLVESDLFYSGGTIIIDHGFGINSTYLHLSLVSVKVGSELKQGDKIGEIGATGRATGPHLDWRLNWKKVRLDPQLLLTE